MPRKEMANRTYQVVFEPEGARWTAEIRAVEGCHTYGRSLPEARERIREALACSLDDLPEEDAVRVAKEAKLVEIVRLPGVTRRKLDRFRGLEANLRNLERQYIAARSDAVRNLIKDAGVSYRDAGDLMGVSPEAIRQWLQSERPRGRFVVHAKKAAKRAAKKSAKSA